MNDCGDPGRCLGCPGCQGIKGPEWEGEALHGEIIPPGAMSRPEVAQAIQAADTARTVATCALVAIGASLALHLLGRAWADSMKGGYDGDAV